MEREREKTGYPQECEYYFGPIKNICVWFEITAGCQCNFEHVTSALIVSYIHKLAYWTRCRKALPHKKTQNTDLHKRVRTQINEGTSTIVLVWTFTGAHHGGPVMCLGDRGQILCDLCGGYIAWEKGTKDLTEAVWGPTITAWNITAAKELSLWQEEKWAPASDSTDQNDLWGRKDMREG